MIYMENKGFVEHFTRLLKNSFDCVLYYIMGSPEAIFHGYLYRQIHSSIWQIFFQYLLCTSHFAMNYKESSILRPLEKHKYLLYFIKLCVCVGGLTSERDV